MIDLDGIYANGKAILPKNTGLSDYAITFIKDPTPDAMDISVSYSYSLITGSRITHSTQLIAAHDGLGGAISSSAGISSDLTSGVSVNIGFYWSKRENRKVMMEDFTQWETNYDASVPLNEIGIPVDLDLGTTNAQNFYGVSVGGSKPSIAPSLGIRKTFTPYVKPIIKF